MCDFVSWIEYKGEILFLTTDHLKDKKGRSLKKRIGDDINGHGAIREYYDIKSGEGKERECTDFSTPDNFPANVVEAIRGGKMKGFGEPQRLLYAPARDEYNKVCDAAWEEFNKVCDPARAELNKVYAPARAEFNKVYVPAREEFNKVRDNKFWDLFARQENRAKAWRD